MKRTFAVITLAAVGAVCLGVGGAAGRTNGTLQVHAVFSVKWEGAACPQGSPALGVCYRNVGHGRVPGLGEVTESYIVVVDDQGAKCVYPHFTAVFAVAGKGEIDISAKSPDCVSPKQPSGTTDYVVTGGSGAYAGAQGGGRQASVAHETGYAMGIATDTWTGGLDVSGLEFDVIAPALQGAKNIIAKAAPGSRRAIVRYQLTAKDDVDGPLPVACRPRSGSRFKLGRSTVTCSATDTSGNSSTARFAVTVKRSRT